MNRGIALMLGATFVFAMQDGLSRHLAEAYSVYMVVMIRYWFFAAFVIALALRTPGGLRAAAATKAPVTQIVRGLLLAAEICVMVTGFVLIGLVESHAIFSIYPLLITMMAGPVLGEVIGWRRWTAVGVGLIGMLIILRPGFGVFAPGAIFPLASATMFALYGLLTRKVAQSDPASVSFFWTGIAGAMAMTAVGLWFWEPMSRTDWMFMAALCVTGVLGHWFLIKAYEASEASAVQPFAYFQLVFGAFIGIGIFGDVLETPVAIGAAIIVGAGIFTLRRQP